MKSSVRSVIVSRSASCPTNGISCSVYIDAEVVAINCCVLVPNRSSYVYSHISHIAPQASENISRNSAKKYLLQNTTLSESDSRICTTHSPMNDSTAPENRCSSESHHG